MLFDVACHSPTESAAPQGGPEGDYRHKDGKSESGLPAGAIHSSAKRSSRRRRPNTAHRRTKACFSRQKNILLFSPDPKATIADCSWKSNKPSTIERHTRLLVQWYPGTENEVAGTRVLKVRTIMILREHTIGTWRRHVLEIKALGSVRHILTPA